MKILVTGAAGFLGTRLVRALLSPTTGLPGVSRIVAADVMPCAVDDPRIESRIGTVTDASVVGAIVDPDVTVVYHLAAVVSGQAESEFDLGMRVNVEATRSLLEACRRLPRPPRVVFTSSLAVFGGALPAIVPEDMVLRPQSSYGTAKAIGELLVSEYSRRGFVDGISCRLPIVAVRPGAPNAAASSFVSGIVREPLTGVDTVCPVALETPLWIGSPETTIRNLVHAARVATSGVNALRAVNLPGLSVTAAEILASLERLGGAAARRRVRCEIDPAISGIVSTWPGAFATDEPLRLGFTADRSVDAIVQQFMAEQQAQG